VTHNMRPGSGDSRASDVEIRIDASEAGGRIDRFLGNRFYPTYSRSFLTGLIDSGEITVNGERVRAAYRVGQGDVIRARLAPRTEDSPVAEDLPLDVLYEDDLIVVVNKPAGILVHPGPKTRRGTLINGLLHRYPEVARVGVVFRPGIVHRLDGETSGVMVVARTNHARADLVDQFKSKLVQKEYRALVVGVMPFDRDYIDLPLGPDPKKADRQRVDMKEGKPSSTFYEVIERLPGATYVRCVPHTGRTHQIRVHLARVGFPVIADPMYGRNPGQAYRNMRQNRKDKGLSFPDIRRHALHAFRLAFAHPVTREQMTFEAPLPEDMQTLLEFYRDYAKE